MYSKEKYFERKEKGLCVQCGKPNDNGKVICDECVLKRKKAYIQRCNKRIAEGGCVLCGKPLWGETQYCEEHYKNKREKQKIRYVESKQEGKCCCCGKPIEEGNKTVYCDNCREKKKESRRAYIENGVCPICKKIPSMKLTINNKLSIICTCTYTIEMYLEDVLNLLVENKDSSEMLHSQLKNNYEKYNQYQGKKYERNYYCISERVYFCSYNKQFNYYG